MQFHIQFHCLNSYLPLYAVCSTYVLVTMTKKEKRTLEGALSLINGKSTH